MVASGTASRVPPIAAKPVTTSSPSSSLASQQRTSQSQSRNAPKQTMTRKRLEDLVKEIDPLEQLDEDVEEVLMQMTDDFIDSVVSHSCTLAKHRESNTLEIKDVQVHLGKTFVSVFVGVSMEIWNYIERCWNMWIPGFGSEEVRPCKKSVTTEAHRQRLALIRKAVKK
jgi:transcription initiation factor TFIID subunit 12